MSTGARRHADTVILWCAFTAIGAVALFEGVRLLLRRGIRLRDWLQVAACLGVSVGIALGTYLSADTEESRIDRVEVAAPTVGAKAGR